MRSSFEKLFGALLVIVGVFVAVFILRRFLGPQAFTPDHLRTRPETPQEYILFGKKIDMNTASADVMETLPGIGRGTAEEVVRYRTVNGPFRDISELDKVKGIGVKTIEKIRPYLSEID